MRFSLRSIDVSQVERQRARNRKRRRTEEQSTSQERERGVNQCDSSVLIVAWEQQCRVCPKPLCPTDESPLSIRRQTLLLQTPVTSGPGSALSPISQSSSDIWE